MRSNRLILVAAGLAFAAALPAARADETSSPLDALEDRALKEESHAKFDEALKSFEEAFGVAVKEAAGAKDASKAERARARAEVYLTKMDEVSGRISAHRQVEEFLKGFKGEDLGPALQGWVEWHRLRGLRRAGQPEKAAEILASLGFVTRWWVVGPFDNERGRGFGAKMGPEGDKGIVLDLAASYPGKERQVAWRAVPAIHPYGWVDLDALLRPNDQALAYAATWIRCDAPREVALRFGSDESLAVWLNGTEMLRRDVIRHGGFDQDSIGVTLAKGWNRVLVKVGDNTGPWGFRMRVTEVDGKPVTDLATPGSDEEVQAAAAAKETSAPAAKAKALRGALDALEPAAPKGATADDGSEDARAYFYLGVLHRARQYDDQKETQSDRKYLERAAKLRPNDPVYRFHAAEAAARPIDMSVEKEENQQRRGREKAVELDPSYAVAYCALAGYYTWSMPNLPRAEEMARKAISLNDGYLEAHLLLVEILKRRGFASEAALALDAIVTRPVFQGRAAVLKAMSAEGNRAGLASAAADAYRKALEVDSEDADSRGNLAEVLKQEGLAQDAVGVYDERVRLNPFDVDSHFRKAGFLEGLGRLPEAAAAAADGLAVAPEDEKLLDLQGRVLHRMGKKDDAVARWREAMRVNPKNTVLKRYVEWLDPSLKPFEEPYIEDAGALLAGVKGREGDNKENDPYLIVLDKGVVRVNPDGTNSTFTQKIVKILNVEGAKRNARYWAGSFWASEQSFEWRSARVWRKDGSVETANVQSGSPMVAWPQLQPGDAVEVQHRVDQLQQTFFGDYFGESWYFADYVPVVRSEWTLLVPASREIRIHSRNMPGKSAEPVLADLDEGKTKSYSWVMRDVPKVRFEARMPSPDETYPSVEVTTYKDWDQFATWWWNLIKKQFTTDDGMKAKVEELTKSATTRLEKVKAIYEFVVTDIQYQAWEFGVHGYKPYTATSIFNRKWGDCKDKAILIRTMLDLVGIEAYPVLIMATNNRSEEDFTLAQVGKFNHCIAYVPDADGNGTGMFLDGTAQYNSMHNVPTMDRGARVLLVKPEGAEVVQIPWNQPEEFRLTEEMKVSLKASGAADLESKVTFSGDFAVEARRQFSVEGKRQQELSKALGALGKHVIEKVDFPDLKDISSPTVEIGLKVKLENLGQVDGSRMTVPVKFPTVFPLTGGLGRLASLEKREHDMVLFNPILTSEKAEYTVPEGWKVAKIPDPKTIETDFALFRVTTSHEGSTVRFEREVRMKTNRVPKEKYAEFRDFVAKANNALTEKIVLEKTSVAEGAPAAPAIEGGGK